MPSSADDLDGQEEGSRSQSRDPQLPNKRKADEESDADSNQKPKANKKPRVNTAVYVTGIPSDAKWDEVHDFFKRFGIIALNPETEEPRVKLYNDDEGAFKGEALITYFKPESINNAIMLADGSDFRSLGDGDLHIQPAEFTHKPDKVANKQQKQQQKQQSGPRKAGSNAQYIEKVKQVNQRLNRKLAEWSDDDIEPEETEKKPRNKFDKFVIVRNMFTAEVLEAEKEERKAALEAGEAPDTSIVDDIPGDIREMAEEQDWGEVLTIEVYDAEPDGVGVVKIKFADAESAQKGVSMLDGRFYDKRQLQAEVQTHRVRFQKAERDEEEEQARLERYGQDLEEGRA